MATVAVPLDSKKLERRRISCETLCSSNSSCVLQKRKPVHPLATSIKSKSSSSVVTQRVLSAKLLRFKTLQNQLNDANYHIAQLVNENKLLKTLQKRQDHALSRYEGAQADLPHVLESHQEEIRVLQTRSKTLRKTVRELNEQLRAKDEELNAMKDQNKHLMNLCKNKNLEEREKLAERIDELEDKLKQSETTISVLNRKIMIETKNYKFKFNAEVSKHKQTQRELNRCLVQIEQMTAMLEGKGKPGEIKKRSTSGDRNLCVMNVNNNKLSSSAKKSPRETKDDLNNTSNSVTNLSDDGNSSSSSFTKLQEELLQDNVVDLDSETKVKKQVAPQNDVLPSSEDQLKDIVSSWHKKNGKSDHLLKEINEYCTSVVSSAQRSNDVVSKHSVDFDKTTKETETIMSALKENDSIHEKLNQLHISGDKMSFLDYTVFKQKDKNANHITHLLNIERSENSSTSSLEETVSSVKSVRVSHHHNNNNNNKVEADNEDKLKLLAKLRAIDNGDNAEIPNMKKNKSDLMKELFG